ncbi:MAG: vanadium-dependent haloperoxidase [Sarcina sp.]
MYNKNNNYCCYRNNFNNINSCVPSNNKHFCNCPCHDKEHEILDWATIPYPGMSELPKGVDKTAGSWPLHFMKRDCNGYFYTLKGEKILFDIAPPTTVDFYHDLLEVQKVQATLTNDQKNMAKFWGTGVPVQQWVPIALEIINLYKVTPPKSARILEALQGAINDAFIITWMFKYHWSCARPCQLDRNLKTFLATPVFPTYPSGHSVVSGATEIVLSFFFPKESYKLHSLAEDASISRLYGGIHFRSDLSSGLKLGRQIGQICVNYLKNQYEIDYLIHK